MDKTKETKPEETPEFKTKHVSTDNEAGIVVYETDAPDGTAFTITIDGDLVKAKSDGGQIWFRAGQAINPSAFIYVK